MVIERYRNSGTPDVLGRRKAASATWHCLVLNGWREDTYRNDRRLYRDVPPSRVAELFDADDPDERTRLLQLAGAEATYRPRIKLANR